MRYTKAALLLFGAGLVLGFAVVVIGGHPRLGRIAAALMAASLVALPAALVVDGRASGLVARLAARFSRGGRKRSAKARSPARPRKPAARPRRTARRSRS